MNIISSPFLNADIIYVYKCLYYSQKKLCDRFGHTAFSYVVIPLTRRKNRGFTEHPNLVVYCSPA
ncbi:conserved domain protein [Ruminococcus albus 8]|uniref:Conserved domain protein n=1 Tax=Ruminococcus albus 8 TaxID=246199 RepID=E9S7A9_RUMAL|nr:conserved domain protein [Ruminococcus albus 8]